MMNNEFFNSIYQNYYSFWLNILFVLKCCSPLNTITSQSKFNVLAAVRVYEVKALISSSWQLFAQEIKVEEEMEVINDVIIILKIRLINDEDFKMIRIFFFIIGCSSKFLIRALSVANFLQLIAIRVIKDGYENTTILSYTLTTITVNVIPSALAHYRSVS